MWQIATDRKSQAPPWPVLELHTWHSFGGLEGLRCKSAPRMLVAEQGTVYMVRPWAKRDHL